MIYGWRSGTEFSGDITGGIFIIRAFRRGSSKLGRAVPIGHRLRGGDQDDGEDEDPRFECGSARHYGVMFLEYDLVEK